MPCVGFLRRPEKGFRCPGAEILSGCKPSDVGVGNQNQVSGRTAKTVKHCAIFPSLPLWFLLRKLVIWQGLGIFEFIQTFLGKASVQALQ